MAIIPGVTVDWSLSPRVIYIPDPITAITIEDLQDTLLDIEDSEEGISFPKLRDASGGEVLGGGVRVGWTLQLANAQIAFEARIVHVCLGTATDNDVTGTSLIDLSSTFITDGVKIGATIINFTDKSISSVIRIISETELRHERLQGGIDNDWTIGDDYKVYNEIQCEVSGGNLVAVNGIGNSISPILATGFVQVIKTSSSSATLQELAALQYSSYQNRVTIDVLNGVAGTDYPIGTAENPVNNLTDAKTIADTNGFHCLYIKGNITIGPSDVISGFSLLGEGSTFNIPRTAITLGNGCITSNTFFEKARIEGRQNGECIYTDCIIGNLTNTHCQFNVCGMIGPVQMNNDSWTQNHTTDLIRCYSSFDWYILDYNNSLINQVYTNYSGKLKIINCTDSRANIMIRLDAGMVWIDASCTAGNISVKGMAVLRNDSNLIIDTEGFTTGETLTEEQDTQLMKTLTTGKFIALK